jgi:RES domain-containing protein
MEPGELYGQGWLYTANSTKLAWESVAQNAATQMELIVEEVYPVGNVDPTLVDI